MKSTGGIKKEIAAVLEPLSPGISFLHPVVESIYELFLRRENEVREETQNMEEDQRDNAEG